MKKIFILCSTLFLLYSCTKIEERNFDSMITTRIGYGLTSFGDTTFTLYMPSGFTPNWDGVNDYYFAIGSGIEPNSFRFKIFSREGNMVFYTTTMNKGWNGTSNDGKEVGPAGVYNAQFEFNDTLDQHHLFQQSIMLEK